MSKISSVVSNYNQAQVDYVKNFAKFAVTPFRVFNRKVCNDLHKSFVGLVNAHPLNPKAWIG